MTPFDRMNPEAYPWPKRYPVTAFNLKRAFVSIYTPGAATNRATHLLFNASTGDRVLVVRGLSFSGLGATGNAPLGVQQGTLGTHAGSEAPLWAGERDGAGQHWYVDTASVLTPQQLLAALASGNEIGTGTMPLAVLPPGWAMFLQGSANAQTVGVSWFWEELRIDDPYLGAIGDQG